MLCRKEDDNDNDIIENIGYINETIDENGTTHNI